MLTVCCLGCSERDLDSHWLPSCLTLWSEVQPTLTTDSSLQPKHTWLHCWTWSKYALLSWLFHASRLCWFSTWNLFSLFSSNGLDHRLGLCREAIERVEYHLHLGYITSVFTFAPTLGFLQRPNQKTDPRCFSVSCPWCAAVHWNQGGGSKGSLCLREQGHDVSTGPFTW